MGLKEFWRSIINKKEDVLDSNAEPQVSSSSKSFAEYEKEFIQNVKIGRDMTFDACALSIKESTISNCQRFDFDLVCFRDYGHGCCEKCATLTGRVYSISGKNKKFPPLPEYVKKHGNFHTGCRCSMSAYFGEETIYFQNRKVNAIDSSNRPYIDYRTNEEKEKYNDYLVRTENEARQSAAMEWDREKYLLLVEQFPEDAPKSFSAYRRMKNSNSAGFQNLREMAANVGIQI